MTAPTPDTRTPQRKVLDEQIASESPLPPPELPPGVVASPVDTHLRPRRPVAVAGVVENGLVRPLDPGVKLPEQARVIIVATEDG
jgi:hypothetical protein